MLADYLHCGNKVTDIYRISIFLFTPRRTPQLEQEFNFEDARQHVPHVQALVLEFAICALKGFFNESV